MRALTILITMIFMFGLGVYPVFCQTNETQQKPTILIVVGAGGSEEFSVEFAQSANILQEACNKANVKYITIGLDTLENNGPEDRLILRQTISNEPNETDAALWIVLIGHGTYDGRTAKFNLRGPDISADEFAEWLEPLHRPVALINTASSSAPFLSKLSSEERIVITATKSGYELNYARFGKYFAQAISSEQESDLDKDGQTSLLEAFLTASSQVAEFYSTEGRLATEHGLLDDNGDGLGTPADWFSGIRPIQKATNNASPDGYRANQFHLIKSELENKMPSELRIKRDELELEVVKLRDSKDSLTEEEYFSRLEKLLYQIAKIYEQIDTQNN
ncbi:hypothetical protein ACFLZ8_04450 [Planctomycetota bacterium]